MSRGSAEKLQRQEEARKDLFVNQQGTGMVQKTMKKIPDDYTPGQRADITTAEMGGLDAGYGNLKDEMLRRASATGSFAGIPESLRESSLDAIRAKAQAGAQLRETFANVPVQRALQQASVFQPASSGLLYSRPPQAQGPSTADSAIGAGATVGATALMVF